MRVFPLIGYIISFTCACLSIETSLASDDKAAKTNIKKLEQRISDLESVIAKMDDISTQAELAAYSYDDLSQQLDKEIQLSGYADVEYKSSEKSGSHDAFRMHHFSLFFSKKFDQNIKFFSEIEYEDAPKFEGENNNEGDLKSSTGKIFVEAVNFDWNYSQQLNFRLGRFFTPAGIWSEDHYPPFVSTQERPLHIRKIFPQLVDGMSLFGATEFSPNHFLNYNVFIGNGESNLSGKKDTNSDKAIGLKANYQAPWLDDFSLGFTVYSDGNDASNDNAEKLSRGVHVKFRYKNIHFQAEYAQADITFLLPDSNYESEGYYAQTAYSLNQLSLGYRFDVFDKTDIDIEEIKRHSLFANYQLNEHFKLKAEYHNDSHKDKSIDEYGFYIFSITGYLGK